MVSANSPTVNLRWSRSRLLLLSLFTPPRIGKESKRNIIGSHDEARYHRAESTCRCCHSLSLTVVAHMAFNAFNDVVAAAGVVRRAYTPN